MRAQSGRGGARLAALCIGLALAGAVPVAIGAEPTSTQAQSVLRGLETERQSALLELYALESELASARADAEALAARRTRVAEEQAATRRRLAVARQAAATSTRRLEELLRSLYVQPGAEPLEILLDSHSLEDALTQLENLEHAAADHRRLLERSRATQAALAHLDAELDARGAELAHLADAAALSARQLEARVAAKAVYIETLKRREHLTAREVSSLETAARTARTARSRSSEPVAPAHTAPVAAPDGTRTLTVSAVGYSLPGRTATGLPVGHGVVAVDPSVIPLGTRMYVPGYGAAVAADVGSAVRGAMIDLWFPTVAKARAWGRRTVVISLG